jgi:hypothetical protein
MKLKLMLAVLALAGLASALALAGPTQAGDGTTGTTTTGTTTTGTTTTGTTTTGKHHDDGDENEHHGNSSCQKVELQGSNASGTVAFTVSQASHGGSALVGKQVTLTVPAGSALSATACTDAAGALTLRGLEVKVPHTAPITTGTSATTTNTTSHSHGHGHGSHK